MAFRCACGEGEGGLALRTDSRRRLVRLSPLHTECKGVWMCTLDSRCGGIGAGTPNYSPASPAQGEHRKGAQLARDGRGKRAPSSWASMRQGWSCCFEVHGRLGSSG